MRLYRWLTILMFLMIAVFLPSIGEGTNNTLLEGEKRAASQVEWISDRQFFYYEKDDCYVVLFSLKDENKERMVCPCYAEVSLVNSDGTEVYSATKYLSTEEGFARWTWSNAQDAEKNGVYGTIYIQPDEIKKSKSPDGKMRIRVYLGGWFSFEEKEFDISGLPTEKTRVVYGTRVPKHVYRKAGKYNQDISITTYSIEVIQRNNGNVDIYVYMTGECVMGTGRVVTFDWKLLDDDGYVVETGSWNFSNLYSGDKFRDMEFGIYNVRPGAYTLEFGSF